MTILYIDTETIPAQRPDVVAWMAARQLVRDAEDDVTDFVAKSKRAQEAYRDTSLSPVLGELAVVSLAIDDNDPITYVREMASPTGERDLVVRVCQELVDIYEEAGIHRIVAHNAVFDRTVLRTRAMVHGARLPYQVHALNLKPWESPWWCTMDALKADYRDGVGLDAACVAFGVPLLKGDIDGSKVWDAIVAGRIDEVAAYCADDVRRVRAVYQRIVGVMS